MEHVNLNQEIAVEYVDYKNPYSFDHFHRHKYFEFILFDKASGGQQIIDFQEYEIQEKSLFLIIPGQVHLMKRLPEENGIIIQCTRSAIHQAIAPLSFDFFSTILLHSKNTLSEAQFDTIWPLFEKMKAIYNTASPLRTHKLKQLLGYILMEIFEVISIEQQQTKIDNIAYQFLNLVQTQIHEHKSVQYYANTLQVSSSKLVKKVNAHLGKSPLQIIHEILLTEIKRYMMAEQLSHKEIAYQLQFDSASSFSRFIKKQTGLSPSQLKEQLVQIAQ